MKKSLEEGDLKSTENSQIKKVILRDNSHGVSNSTHSKVENSSSNSNCCYLQPVGIYMKDLKNQVT